MIKKNVINQTVIFPFNSECIYNSSNIHLIKTIIIRKKIVYNILLGIDYSRLHNIIVNNKIINFSFHGNNNITSKK